MADQPAETVNFNTEETRDMSGLYHKLCARPFQSMARIINFNPWAR